MNQQYNGFQGHVLVSCAIRGLACSQPSTGTHMHVISITGNKSLFSIGQSVWTLFLVNNARRSILFGYVVVNPKPKKLFSGAFKERHKWGAVELN